MIENKGDVSLFQRPEGILENEQELTECRLVERDPIRIYSTSGTLLREYPDFCEIDVPVADRQVISHQVMIQGRESDVAFLKKDLLFAAEYQFSEIRLIGRSFIFSIKSLDRSWPDPAILAEEYEGIEKSSDLAGLLEKIRNSPQLRENSWDPEIDLIQIRSDIICKKIADIFSLDYRKAPYVGCYIYPKKWRNGKVIF
jgi:hypothetical protein